MAIDQQRHTTVLGNSAVSVVAECCCNHMGNFEIAKQMIDKSAKSGADFVKFQKWNPEFALSDTEYNKRHPNPSNSFGEPYGVHRQNLEFSLDQHRALQAYSVEKGVSYCCSVFDKVSAKEIVSLNPPYIKIPSQKNLKSELYDIVCKEFEGDIHVSTGMTDNSQVEAILDNISNKTSLDRVVLYCTTSSYPCRYEDLYLLRISDYLQRFGNDVKAIGFSGHHNGIAADIAAITLGAEFVERHFTLDRTMKGTDQAASLEPQGLEKLVRDIKNVQAALQNRPDRILDVELDAYNKVKREDAQRF